MQEIVGRDWVNVCVDLPDLLNMLDGKSVLQRIDQFSLEGQFKLRRVVYSRTADFYDVFEKSHIEGAHTICIHSAGHIEASPQVKSLGYDRVPKSSRTETASQKMHLESRGSSRDKFRKISPVK